MSGGGKASSISRIGDRTVLIDLEQADAEFSEWQGRTVAVVDGRRVGGADDLLLLMDERRREAIVIATQSPGDRFATWRDENDIHLAAETAVAAGTAVGRRLTEAGFSLERLGPCLNWTKSVDEATGESLVVSNDALRAVAEPTAAVWLVGRRRGDGWIFAGELDLETAIDVVERLPAPGRGEETSLVGRDDALGFLDGREGPSPAEMDANFVVHASGRSGP